MCHNDGPDHARGHSPARRPAKLLFALAILKLNPASSGEVLSEKMRRACLNGFAVLSHGFDRQRLDRAWKLFTLGFFTVDHRNRAAVAHEFFVDVEHAPCFRARFRVSLVNGVPFLPEKFSRSQK